MNEMTMKPFERRRHPRTHLEMTLRGVRLDPDCNSVVDSFRMRDISKTGMGAVVSRPFYPGQRILLNLPLTAGARRRSVYARIIRCQGYRQEYIIGMEFETASLGARAQTDMELAAA